MTDFTEDPSLVMPANDVRQALWPDVDFEYQITPPPKLWQSGYKDALTEVSPKIARALDAAWDEAIHMLMRARFPDESALQKFRDTFLDKLREAQ